MITVSNISKTFYKGSTKEVKAVENVSLNFPDTGLICITGQSGSGKSTFLNLVGLIEKFDSGEINFKTNKLTAYKMERFDYLRNHLIGHIYQNYHLDPELTVYENLALKLTLSGRTDKDENKRVINYALQLVGMEKYAKRLASNLSGGQKQRVGIARAIVLDPEVILADEPTGNLDVTNTYKVMELLKEISKEKLVLLVTHEVLMAQSFADRIITFEDGKIKSDEHNDDSSSYNFINNQQININGLKHEQTKTNNITINCYSDANIPLTEITVVIKNNKIYLESKSEIKPVLVTPASGLEIINKNTNEMTKNSVSMNLGNFTYNKDVSSKPTNPLSSRKMFVECLKRVFVSRKFFGRLFLLNIIFFGLIITFLVSQLTAKVKSFTPDHRFNNKTVYLYSNTNKYEFDKVKRAVRSEHIKKFYYQTNLYDDTQFYSLVFKNMKGETSADSTYYAHISYGDASGKTIVAGKGDLATNGCLVSTSFLDQVIKKTIKDDFIYFTAYQDFIGETINRKSQVDIFSDKLNLAISGVFKSKVSQIIVNDLEKINLLTEINYSREIDSSKIITPELYGKFLFDTSYKLQFYDTLGNKLLENPDFNTLGNNEIYLSKYYLGDTKSYLEKIGKNRCQIIGFYEVVDADGKLLKKVTRPFAITSESNRQDILLYNRLDQNKYGRATFSKVADALERTDKNNDTGLIFELNNIEEGTKVLRKIFGKNTKVVNANNYFNKTNVETQIRLSLPSVITLVVVVVVCIFSVFFLVRTSVLARKKDIIMLRLIGVSKFYILKEFIFEILIYFFIFYVLGVVISTSIIGHGLWYATLLKRFLILDPATLIITHSVMLILFIIFGTIPILFLTRKTPASLQTTNEL